MTVETPLWPPGNGEMAELIRRRDWSRTPLGPVSTWPHGLRVAIEICLSSGFASFVCWGSDLIQFYNDAGILMLGSKHPAALGISARETWSDIWPVAGPLIDRVLETGEPVRGDDTTFRPLMNGVVTEGQYTFCYSALRDDDGRIMGLNVVSLNTTARFQTDRFQRETIAQLRQSESERREGEERLRLALDAAKMGIWVWDIAESTYHWNDQFYRLLGYEPGDVTPGHEAWSRRVHPDDLPQLESRIPELIATGQEFHGEHRVLGRNDAVCWVESWGRFTAGADGHPLRYFGVMCDITDRKRLDQELRDSEQRLRLALDAAHMGILEWDIRAGTYRWNDQTYRLLGYEPQSVVPGYAAWSRRVHPADLPKLEAEAQQLMQSPRDASAEYRVYGANGELRWLEARGRYELDADGHPLRYYGVLIDITARKRSEERDRILTAEVNHRAKNLLAVVQAVAFQTARSDGSKEFFDKFNRRLAGLAASHDLLVGRSGSGSMWGSSHGPSSHILRTSSGAALFSTDQQFD